MKSVKNTQAQDQGQYTCQFFPSKEQDVPEHIWETYSTPFSCDPFILYWSDGKSLYFNISSSSYFLDYFLLFFKHIRIVQCSCEVVADW